jgi:hypothetical protein
VVPTEGKTGALQRVAFCFCELQRATENCVLLGCYAASTGNSLPIFQDNLSVPTSSFFLIRDLEMGPICCTETSVRNYHYSLRNNPEERSPRLLRGGSLKSRTACYCQSVSGVNCCVASDSR